MAINNYFIERINQYQKKALQKLVRGNPFRSLVPMSAFDLSEGRTPTVRTVTHELPTSYPTSMTEVKVSDGGSEQPCDVTPTTIKRGEIHRTFKLYETAHKTDTLCLSDLKRAEDMANAASAFERALVEYTNVWWGDWYRLQNIAMVNRKVSTKTSGAIDSDENSDTNHTGLADLPTAHLSWDHLKQLYWDLIRAGVADELAVGRDSKGRPILPLVAGAGVINALWGDTTSQSVVEQVKYFDSAKNLQVLGYDGAVNGFLPVLDLFPIRYGKSGGIATTADLTLANAIYPTENVSATVGKTYAANADYALTTKAGLAEFEVVSILGRDVYEAKYESVAPSEFSGMKFDTIPQNFVGDFSWINNRTFEGANDRGNKGYYLADIRCGAKPLFPEFGISIVTKARDV